MQKTTRKGPAAYRAIWGAAVSCFALCILAAVLGGCGGSKAPAAPTTAPQAGQPGALTPGQPPGGMTGGPGVGGGSLMPGGMPGGQPPTGSR